MQLDDSYDADRQSSTALQAHEQILDIDAFLASEENHLPEKLIRVSIDPSMAAKLDDLQFELESMTDAYGRPTGEATVGEQRRSIGEVVEEIKAARTAGHAAMRSIRLRALCSADFSAFKARHTKVLEAGAPYPDVFWDELVVACALEPRFTPETVAKFRARVGAPAFDLVAFGAWDVNTKSGLNVPELSARAAAVLRRIDEAESGQ